MSDLSKYIKSSVTASELKPFKATNTTKRSFTINEKKVDPGEDIKVSAKDAVFLKGEGFEVQDDIAQEDKKREEQNKKQEAEAKKEDEPSVPVEHLEHP